MCCACVVILCEGWRGGGGGGGCGIHVHCRLDFFKFLNFEFSGQNVNLLQYILVIFMLLSLLVNLRSLVQLSQQHQLLT